MHPQDIYFALSLTGDLVEQSINSHAKRWCALPSPQILAAMTNIISAHAPQDFLAIVPYLAGFVPERSIVLVAFRGNKSCGALRFDLPPSGPVTILKRVATTFVGMLCKVPGVDAVVPVVYTEESFEDGHIPHADFAHILCERARMSGFLVRDALCVARDGWGSFLADDWPDNGYPLAMIADSPAAMELPSDPRSRLGTVADGCQLPVVNEKQRRETARFVARHHKLANDENSLPAPLDAADTALQLVSLIEDMLELDVVRCVSGDAAVAIMALQTATARDTALLQWSFGAAMGLRVIEEDIEFAARPDLESADDETARLLFGVGPRPDPVRIERAIEVLKLLAALAPRAESVILLSMLGWLNWALGRGSMAGGFIDRARQIAPNDGFACLLDTVLASGHLPEWAFHPLGSLSRIE